MARLVDLELERREWHAELARAAEAWVTAKARGAPPAVIAEIDERMQRAERQTRRVERRIRRARSKVS